MTVQNLSHNLRMLLLAAASLWAIGLSANDNLKKSAENVYKISTPQDLLDFSDVVNGGESDACAILTANLDMTGYSYIPIGNTEGTRYQGTFDGGGFCIDNLTINAPDQNGVGIFGYVENASIQNLIAGAGNKVHGRAFVGGIVGDKVSSGTATLRQCGHEGNVVCVAENGAAMVGCVHSGNLIIDHCYNTGKVQGGRESAIFCGWFSGANSMIADSYNSGTLLSGVEGSNYLWRATPAAERVFDIQGRQNTTRFTQEELSNGALAWSLNGNSPQGCFRQNLDGEQKDAFPTTRLQHAIVYACGQLQCNGTPLPGTTVTYANVQQSTYLPHNFEEGICSVCENVDEEYLYPDAKGYYQLATPYALRWFAAYVNSDPAHANLCARLTADLDMKGISFQGLGSTTIPYAGEFDGGSQRITNLVMKRTDETGVGFVNVAHTSIWLHDLTLGASCSITGYRYVGGFIGKVDGVSGDNIRLARLGFEGIVTGNNNCGAIIGCIPNNDIVAHFKTCYSIGTINGTAECGALSGWSSRARLTNCYARVRRSGFEADHDVVRGFTPIFRNCYAYGAKQKSDGLSSFTATELSNGTLLEKLNDPAYSQTIGTDSNPKLRKKE